MSQEIPDWQKNMPDEIKAQIGIELKQFKTPYTCCDGAHEAGFIQGFNAAYRFLSKPENAAKLECVKPVIKGLQKYLDNTLFVDEEGESYDSDFEHCIDFAKTALKPFQEVSVNAD